MAQSFRLKRFTNVAILKRIDFALLIRFFESQAVFRRFLEERGLRWTHDPDQFEFEDLARILMSPGVDTPEALLDALYFVDNLADPDCYERILHECQELEIDLGTGDPSPEDLTLLAWLADPNILERVHAEQYRARPQKFESYFTSMVQRPDMPHLSDELLRQLEDDLNGWYEFKKKGRGARVFPFVREDGVWLLIRHGQRIKREGTVEADGESGSVFYRPEKFDVLILYPQSGELAINTETKGERQAFCLYLGKHLFGDEAFFRFDDPVSKYTLQPLIDHGRQSLLWNDVDGLDGIDLIELHIEHDSEQHDLEIRRSHDVFRALKDKGRNLADESASIRLVRAKFRVRFVGGKERIVTIEPPNIAAFDRESDSAIIHEWMTRRGFICYEQEQQADVDADAVLATA